MAEFCLDCWNELNGSHDTEREWVLTKDLNLCEGCGQWKQTILVARRGRLLYDLKRVFTKK